MIDTIIRQATLTDAAVFAELSARTFFDTYAADNKPEDMDAYIATYFGPEQQAEELANPDCVVLFADIDGTIAAYAKMEINQPPDCATGSRPIELARIYSDKPWIGKSLGSTLMQACLTEAQNRGFDTLWLVVWERNLRGQAFYRKWGFVQVGEQNFQLGDDLQNDYILQRPITP